MNEILDKQAIDLQDELADLEIERGRVIVKRDDFAQTCGRRLSEIERLIDSNTEALVELRKIIDA